MTLDPYIKIFASYILLDESMKALKNEDLGSLVRSSVQKFL